MSHAALTEADKDQLPVGKDYILVDPRGNPWQFGPERGTDSAPDKRAWSAGPFVLVYVHD